MWCKAPRRVSLLRPNPLAPRRGGASFTDKLLEAAIGNRQHIGLFIEATRGKLPKELRIYLSSPDTIEWHEKYAKSFAVNNVVG